jgi:hypothetical protein
MAPPIVETGVLAARTRARQVYCSQCGGNAIEPSDDAPLSPNFKFICKDCYRPDNRVKGFIAHDPRLRTSGKRPRDVQLRDCIENGLQLDRKSPKPIRGPEWAYSDVFLRELLSGRSEEEKGRALSLICGRWREHKTFEELGGEDARKALSVLRTQGNALWAKNKREEAKARKRAVLSARAKGLFDRDLTVRQVADILDCSVGYASELRSSGKRTATVFTKRPESGSKGKEVWFPITPKSGASPIEGYGLT